MVTTEALKLLYKKLGGAADVDNITAISDMVDLIEDVAGGGSGASGLLIHYVDPPGAEMPYLDKTYAEITQCLENGIRPVILYENDSEHYVNSYIDSYFNNGDDLYAIIIVDSTVEGYEVTNVGARYFKSTSPDGTLIEFYPE